jgi:uncharacterized protein (TIGR02594 family)
VNPRVAQPDDPGHLKAAFSLLGLSEIAGARHEKKILAMFAAAGHAQVKTDETPWCAAFVRWCLIQDDVEAMGSLMARSLATFGKGIQRNTTIPRGAIAIWPRGQPPAGHTNFVLLDDGSGYVLCIGGNQSLKGTNGAVTISRSRKSEALAYRLPPNMRAKPKPEPEPEPEPVPDPVPEPQPQPDDPGVEPDVPAVTPAVTWWKRPFVKFGGMIATALGMGGVNLSVDAQFLWGFNATIVIMGLMFAAWVFAFPPRGKFVKGIFK